MNLYLQDKVILLTDGGDFLVSLIARLLEEEGAIPCRIPLIDPEYCFNAVQETVRLYGRIDGLVNTLAADDRVGLEQGDYTRFLQSLQQHVVFAYVITQAVRPWLQATGGAIVNMIGHLAETGNGQSSGYAAANGGRMGLTTAWASELSGQGIRVNGVVIKDDQQPEIAETVAFLLSPLAAGVRGELVYVDKGYVHLDKGI